MQISVKNILCIFLGAIALTSCRQELCYDHFRRSQVTIDYEKEWERDYGENHAENWNDEACEGTYDSNRPGEPESVSMTVYPADGSQPALHFLDAKGGEVNLGEGPYDILFYNNDTEYIVINDAASLPDATATTTTRSRATLLPLHRGERTVSPPDVLYGAYISQVPPSGVHETTPMPVTMRPLVYTYIIRYEFEEGVEFVKLARGALAGMAEKVYLRDGSTGDDAATVLFDCEVTSWGVIAKVKTFGVPGFPGEHYGRDGAVVDPALRFTLNLEAMLPNGKIKTFEYDVTGQMQRQPRGGVITVSGLYVIDEESQVESGFEVDVDDWGDWTDVDLPTIEVD